MDLAKQLANVMRNVSTVKVIIQKKKYSVMKDEIRYLTNFLNIKDKRLVMGNKGWQELKKIGA